jgi:hypothetical protein
VYGLGFSNTGVPVFTYLTGTDESSSGRVGVGPPTITTYKGQPGTGIVWIVDPDAGIRAYNAVPVNGKMIRIPLPATPFVGKFQRPAFGNGRYYMSTTNNNILVSVHTSKRKRLTDCSIGFWVSCCPSTHLYLT